MFVDGQQEMMGIKIRNLVLLLVDTRFLEGLLNRVGLVHLVEDTTKGEQHTSDTNKVTHPLAETTRGGATSGVHSSEGSGEGSNWGGVHCGVVFVG